MDLGVLITLLQGRNRPTLVQRYDFEFKLFHMLVQTVLKKPKGCVSEKLVRQKSHIGW